MRTHLTKKPGEFRATCRKGSWMPLEQLTPEERADLDRRVAEVEARGEYTSVLQRWDRKRKAEVGLIECSLDTNDRAEYLEHVRRFHPEFKTPKGENSALVARATGKWHGPKAKPEGSKVIPSNQEIGRSLKTCERCGLIAEINYAASQADRRWWNEHLSMCAGAGAEAGAA